MTASAIGTACGGECSDPGSEFCMCARGAGFAKPAPALPVADTASRAWRIDSQREHARVLTGRYAHWCAEWDFLTIDETCREWPCGCYPAAEDVGTPDTPSSVAP